MSNPPPEEEGDRPRFPPEPPGEEIWPPGSEQGAEEDVPPEGRAVGVAPGDDPSLGTPFFGTDPQSWESGVLKQGATIEFTIEDI